MGADPRRNPRQPRVSHETSDVPEWTMSIGWSLLGVWRGYIGRGFWGGRRRLGGRASEVAVLDCTGILNRSVRQVETESSAEATSGGISCL